MQAGLPERSDSEIEELLDNSSLQLAMGKLNGRGTMHANEQVMSRSSVRHRSVSRELGTRHKFYAVRWGQTPRVYFS